MSVSEALKHHRSSELWSSVWLLNDNRTLNLSCCKLGSTAAYTTLTEVSRSSLGSHTKQRTPEIQDNKQKLLFPPSFNLAARSFSPSEKDGPSTSSPFHGDPSRVHFSGSSAPEMLFKSSGKKSSSWADSQQLFFNEHTPPVTGPWQVRVV